MAQTVDISFPHGLGDCANFALVAQLYREHGVDVRVACEANKHAFFKTVGVPTLENGSEAATKAVYHPWWEPDHLGRVKPDNILSQNKIWRNIAASPLPTLPFSANELWDKLLQLRKRDLFDRHRELVAPFIADLPGPLLLIHAHGNTSSGQKDMPTVVPRDLMQLFLERTGGSIVILDWDNRIKWAHSSRIRHINYHFDKQLATPDALMGLLASADLFIGIDSGPFHLAGVADIPSIGVWFDHHPLRYALPRQNCLNIVAKYFPANLWGAEQFNIVTQPITADYIVAAAEKMLSSAKFALPIGADAQLQLMLAKCFGGIAEHVTHVPNVVVDRHLSFAKIFEYLQNLHRPFRIVETGCIRADNDWAGAGYSTFLFGLFAKRFNSTLQSIDLSAQNINYAKTACATLINVSFCEADSVAAISSLSHLVDFFYLDSMDANVPGHAEHGLREAQSCVNKITADGLIAIDDTINDGGKFFGKGALAVPWLLDNGWKILFMGHQIVLKKA